MRTLPLTGEEFDSLASGLGSAPALARLVAGQAAKRRLLLWGAVRDARRLDLSVAEPIGLIRRVVERSSAAFDDVLSHPQVDAWAAGFPVETDVGYLYGLAAAAALRAGQSFTMEVPASDGVVSLPGLALIDVGRASCRLDFDGSRLTVDGGPARLRRLRKLDLTDLDGPVVVLEELDRYRDRYGEPVAARPVDPAQFGARWRAAWLLLAADYPLHARAVKAMLRSFVPLEPMSEEVERSGVSSRANGSIAIALPATAEAMARLVLHETQHLKLDALLDLTDLTQGDGQPRHYAPWRGDLRPARALLQGTYAHLGVAEFWRGRDARLFAYWHGQSTRAVDTLAGSGELTEAGERFVAGMRATLTAWASDPVPAGDRHVAEVCARVNELVWRLGHRTLRAEDLATLGVAWAAGAPAPAGVEGESRGGRSADARVLSTLNGGRLADGDRALFAGDDREAAQYYARRIETGNGTDDDWAGLAVAMSTTARPEVARDLYRAVRSADPREVLRWSAG